MSHASLLNMIAVGSGSGLLNAPALPLLSTNGADSQRRRAVVMHARGQDDCIPRK